jgi:hypothetical protein
MARQNPSPLGKRSIPEGIPPPEPNDQGRESVLEYRRRLKEKRDRINEGSIVGLVGEEFLEKATEAIAQAGYMEGRRRGKWDGLFWGFVLGALSMLLFTIITGG